MQNTTLTHSPISTLIHITWYMVHLAGKFNYSSTVKQYGYQHRIIWFMFVVQSECFANGVEIDGISCYVRILPRVMHSQNGG